MMRVIWAIFQPSNSLLMLVALAVLLWLIGRRRPAKWLLWASVTIFAAIMVLPVSGALLLALETRFPAPVLPERIDGIITLGGAVNTRTTEHWGRPQVNERIERLTEAARLSRRYPEATLLVSGGHWAPSDKLSEAEVARDLFAGIGLPLDHAVFEDKSRTTWENGVYSKELVKPQPGQTWVLVTSSYHMPRAVGVFRELGWTVIPYPVDYMTNGTIDQGAFTSVGYRLAGLDFAVREWLALVAYHLMGRTSELFPRWIGGCSLTVR